MPDRCDALPYGAGEDLDRVQLTRCQGRGGGRAQDGPGAANILSVVAGRRRTAAARPRRPASSLDGAPWR